MTNINLIPPLMLQKMKTRDSLLKVREEERNLKNELRNIQDTLQSEDNLTEAEVRSGKSKKNKLPEDRDDKKPAKKDMVIPAEQRKPVTNKKDTSKK